MDTNRIFHSVGFSASIPGAGHIRRGIPCQDASEVVTEPRPVLIVCDGRGSASHSHFGAQAAVKAFKSQVAVFEPMMTSMLDSGEANLDRWNMFCRILYRTLMQVKLDLAAETVSTAPTPVNEKEFDFTVACAVVGKKHIGCFQVGDGAIVLRQNEKCITVFEADKGEFSNQTQFLREGGERKGKFHAELFDATVNSGIAITSDGPEHLMFQLPDMIPGPVFDSMFRDLAKGELIQQDIMDYLTRSAWNNDPRGADDRSLAILFVEPVDGPKSEPKSDVEAKTEAKPDAVSESEPKSDVEAKTEAKPDAVSEAEPKSDVEAKTETETKADPAAELKTEAESEAKQKTSPEIKPDADPVSPTTSVSQPESEAMSDQKAHSPCLKPVKTVVMITTACLLACGVGIAGTSVYCNHQCKTTLDQMRHAHDTAITLIRKDLTKTQTELVKTKTEADTLKSKLAVEIAHCTDLENTNRKLLAQQRPVQPMKQGKLQTPASTQTPALTQTPTSTQTPASAQPPTSAMDRQKK